MAQISFDDKEFQQGVKALEQKMNTGSRKSLELLAWHIIGDAEPFTPMNDGYLKDSATVDPNWFGDVALGYNIKYAARLHEHPEFRFRKHRHPNAKGKWLEDTIKQNLTDYNDWLGKKVQEAIS